MNTIADQPEPRKRKPRGKAAPHPDPILAALGFSRTIDKRFWSRVRKTETCWLWTGRTDDKGYGAIHIGGAVSHTIHAHRASWMLHFGNVPKGLEVCHSCDKDYPTDDNTYRLCVRPDHLHLATHAENMHECAEKGRARSCHGESHGNSKLTTEQVLQIRRRYKKHSREHGIFAIGRDFGVHGATIHGIVTRQSWSHV